jgi:type IV secretion system protein VirD4
VWSETRNYRYQSGDLFLGHDGKEEIGIETERHALTIAGAGAGKGACVIIPNLLRWPHNALVIDPKGEAAEATAEKREAMGQAVHVLDPFQSSRVPDRFRSSYNPLDDIDLDARTVREDISAIADGIVMRPDASAAHWDDGAQSLISGLIAYVLATAEIAQRNLIEVRRILADDDRLADAMKSMKGMDDGAGLCREAYGVVFAKEGSYFVSNARKNTQWLDSRGMVDALASSSFSLADLKAGKASVFLVLPANYLGQHGRFLRLFVRCGIEAMARKLPSGDLRGAQCLFLLDEFFSLGYIGEIAKAAGLMRGYGLQLWPILQDLGQLITLYGREGSETFFGNADLHQFFGNTDKLTLDYMSQMTGAVSVEEVGLPPSAPIVTGGGQSIIAATSAHSKSGAVRGAGAAFGAFSSGINQLISAAESAEHQDQMAIFQQKMATVGRPRLTTEQIAQLVKRKSDVVADNMFCIAYGSEKLLLKPSPFFREFIPPKKTMPEEEAIGMKLKKLGFYTGVNLCGLSGLILISAASTQAPDKQAAGFILGALMIAIWFWLFWKRPPLK